MSEKEVIKFLRSALRRASQRWGPIWKVRLKARRPYKGPNKRQKHEYQCAKCKKYWIRTKINVDHVKPAGTLQAFSDLPAFAERLFCGEDGLQVLCLSCHKEKGRKTVKKPRK